MHILFQVYDNELLTLLQYHDIFLHMMQYHLFHLKHYLILLRSHIVQLLFQNSEESPGVDGLGLIPGSIIKISDENGKRKIPHMGWNSLSFPVKGRLFEGIEEGSEVYFVHSYYLPLTAEGAGMQKPEYLITAAADYGVEIGASIEKDNVFGCQFHPEKSGRRGLKILENFLKV